MIEYPFDPFIPHFIDTISYFWNFFGLPLVLLIPGAIFLPLLNKNKKALLILLWAVIPFCYELQYIKAFTARYILFCIPLLLILIAYEIDFLFILIRKSVKSKQIASLIIAGFLVILMLWPIYFTYNLITNPVNAPLPRRERRGYLEDWTAGYGFKEIAKYLDERSKKEKIIVGTEGFFGTLPDGLQIYLDKNRQVIIRGEKATVSEDLRKTSGEYTTFFVTNRSRYLITQPDLELIREYPKAIGPDMPPDSILFYKVLPLDEGSDSARLK